MIRIDDGCGQISISFGKHQLATQYDSERLGAGIGRQLHNMTLDTTETRKGLLSTFNISPQNRKPKIIRIIRVNKTCTQQQTEAAITDNKNRFFIRTSPLIYSYSL